VELGRREREEEREKEEEKRRELGVWCNEWHELLPR
jgi:hypothetical protein